MKSIVLYTHLSDYAEHRLTPLDSTPHFTNDLQLGPSPCVFADATSHLSVTEFSLESSGCLTGSPTLQIVPGAGTVCAEPIPDRVG
jgi:hypothetical protein